MTKQFEIKVLFEGFSRVNGDILEANCSCTLIKGSINIIIDTRTAWDGPAVVKALNQNGLTPEEINFVICTHGHSDHIGTNYLFCNAVHIVGFSISKGEKYFLSPSFNKGEEFIINEHIKVIPTPGHTLQDVSVIFQDQKGQIFAITGDLFENEQDLTDDSIWIEAGSDNIELQMLNRAKILKLAHYIIPGHGPLFKV